MRPSIEQDILQAVMADLRSYEDLRLTASERSELVSTTLVPLAHRCYRWLPTRLVNHGYEDQMLYGGTLARRASFWTYAPLVAF